MRLISYSSLYTIRQVSILLMVIFSVNIFTAIFGVILNGSSVFIADIILLVSFILLVKVIHSRASSTEENRGLILLERDIVTAVYIQQSETWIIEQKRDGKEIFSMLFRDKSQRQVEAFIEMSINACGLRFLPSSSNSNTAMEFEVIYGGSLEIDTRMPYSSKEGSLPQVPIPHIANEDNKND